MIRLYRQKLNTDLGDSAIQVSAMACSQRVAVRAGLVACAQCVIRAGFVSAVCVCIQGIGVQGVC